MSSTRFLVAALAAALALPAFAQPERNETLGDRIRREKRGDPAPAPPARPAPPAAQGQAQAAEPWNQQTQTRLTEEQRAALGAVQTRNELAIRAGELATSRGATPEVQALGRRLVEEHQRAGAGLAAFAAQRGAADVKALPQSPDRQRIEGELGQLSSKSGEEFDREFISFLTRNHSAVVDDLKRARDVTPGQDSSFKEWLDGFENLEEEHLTASRQLKASRQARTPPAR